MLRRGNQNNTEGRDRQNGLEQSYLPYTRRSPIIGVSFVQNYRRHEMSACTVLYDFLGSDDSDFLTNEQYFAAVHYYNTHC